MPIMREWRAEIRRTLKDEYVAYVNATGIVGYRQTPGNLGAIIATRDIDAERTLKLVERRSLHQGIRRRRYQSLSLLPRGRPLFADPARDGPALRFNGSVVIEAHLREIPSRGEHRAEAYTPNAATVAAGPHAKQDYSVLCTSPLASCSRPRYRRSSTLCVVVHSVAVRMARFPVLRLRPAQARHTTSRFRPSHVLDVIYGYVANSVITRQQSRALEVRTL
jgi:hypothetical protein